MSPLSIDYRVAFPDPGAHLYQITLTVTDLPAGRHRLRLPVWTPGSYRIGDFSRNVFDVRLTFNRTEWPLMQSSKNQWDFETPLQGSLVVDYQVYAYELGVRTSHLDLTHAYWNGAQLFFLVDDLKAVPHIIDIAVPPSWRVSTGLDPVPGHPHRYRAADYDVLIDSPVEVGTQRELAFDVDGIPHTVAIWGSGNEDPKRLVADLQKIVHGERELFGELPYLRYVFIFHLTDRRLGGLEHLNSTTCGMERFSFRPGSKSYRRVLGLIAHEVFHLWNVKRIHPEALGPFDYDREVYTRLLWAMEGLTEYYAGLLLLRAGLYQFDEYLERLATAIQTYEQQPGRFVQSLSQASLEAWTKFYHPGPETPNLQISYYLKGELVGLCLDLEIRRRSEGKASLDDVLRRLYDRYGRKRVGFPEAAYQEMVEEVSQSSFDDFFRRYVDSVDPLPLDDLLSWAGLTVQRQWKPTGSESEPVDRSPTVPRAWLGVKLRWAHRAYVEVETSYRNGPAASRLAPGDRIVALNGFWVEKPEDVERRIEEDHVPGDVVTLHWFRRGRLETQATTLGQAPPNDVKVAVSDPMSDDQALRLRQWLTYTG